MKLYHARGTCSLAPHIVLYELDIPFEAESVQLREKVTASGADYRQINPQGYVPALQLDSGEILTEAAIILQYLADQKPAARLIPAAGTIERYRVLAQLHYISTELHKQFSPLFNPQVPEEYKAMCREKIVLRLQPVEQKLAAHDYVMGSDLTIADAYLFTVVRWSPAVGVDLGELRHVAAFQQRMAERPSVQRAMKAEGLLSH